MNIPVPSVLDIVAFATTLPAKLSKDERRIQLFVADLPNVAARLAATEPAKAPEFAMESGALMVKWIEAISKVSLKNFTDPFKGARDDTRKFAAKWDMSPTVVQELG